MRRTFPFLLSLLCIISSCNQNSSDSNKTEPGEKEANAIQSQDTSANQPNPKIEFGNLIPGRDAIDYVRHYKKIYQASKQTTNAVWFSKEFIKYVNEAMQQDGGVDGVRIYLGAYDTPPTGVVTHHKDQISLFWMATRPSQTDANRHLNDTSFFKLPQKLTPKTQVLNHGKLCPPDICETY